MNNERYLEPPDEIEAKECEFCGQEMEIVSDWLDEKYWECKNRFCPENFTGTAKEMAEKLVETLDTLSRVEKRLKFLSKKIEKLEFHRDEGK
jgi:hypothetical protein